VALWVGAHEPGQTFESVANQLCLTQLLGHHRYPLVRRPEHGIISFHLHLPFGSGTFYATTGARVLECHDPLPGPPAIFFSQPILFHDRRVRHPQCPTKLSFAALPELPALHPHEIFSHAEEPS
jgi:hypothetical protein